MATPSTLCPTAEATVPESHQGGSAVTRPPAAIASVRPEIG